ncbi:hypothetical protein DTO166G4_6645 [Paecilomyces variotii]|nr:hypothetical protein DTO166G4_6645 [Paecilomyces variotii]KAJ9234082.1 hypothetical protein DTO166G5_5359 [Paecilomyces variotii]KAJ9250967.1 hypothetical protein DTO195F2_7984 [Paecilomyces variotii]KAJ9292239.1 hypothetical protein DTO021C3_132 [Paecilomyces variotii]KAJ9358490.1 hypothetical protein DTO280E4_5046 [Paecilomyces variotii]
MPVSVPHIHSRRRSSLNSNRSSVDESKAEASGAEDETVVEPDQGNVLSHIISQLRPGADLSRVVLPTFILEPRSMLERITNFMAHPETLLPISTIDDPLERFVAVVKFYLSGWHIKPPGVKKPLNPVLGETFTCWWDYPDGTRGYYVSEQTSHHPPKSSYFFMAPEHHIRIDGTLKPRSKFLGNSAASMMEGIAFLRLLNRGSDKTKGEKYTLTQPNMYARGILFGKMKYELGDHSFVRCPENNLVADIEFKTKGYFSGTYNALGGTIKNEKTGQVYYELSGLWNGEMHIKNVSTGKKELLFNATNAKYTPPKTRPLEEQTERESQKLWYNTVKALIARNHDLATTEKSKVEDRQREEAAKRVDEGVEWKPRLFRPVKGGPGGPDEGEEDLDWIINAQVDSQNPELAVKQILAIAPILQGQKVSHEFEIPPRSAGKDKATDDSGNPIDSAGENAAPGPGGLSQAPNAASQDQGASSSSSGLVELPQPSQSQQPGNPLQRRDTNTKEVDEFVDAKEQ